MDERRQLIAQFDEALAACGLGRARPYNHASSEILATASLGCPIADAKLHLRQDARMDFEPALYLAGIDTYRKAERHRGRGRALLFQVFDLADAAGLELVTVYALTEGVYFHAAHYARCADDWDYLQSDLLESLDHLSRTAAPPELTAMRQQQIDRAQQLVTQSDGQLGDLVASLREPVIGLDNPAYPTLAKYLFLHPTGSTDYDGAWRRQDRDRARAAYSVTGMFNPTIPVTPPSPRGGMQL